MKSFLLSTKESLNRDTCKIREDRKGKGGFPKTEKEIFAAKFHCVECMFYNFL